MWECKAIQEGSSQFRVIHWTKSSVHHVLNAVPDLHTIDIGTDKFLLSWLVFVNLTCYHHLEEDMSVETMLSLHWPIDKSVGAIPSLMIDVEEPYPGQVVLGYIRK